MKTTRYDTFIFSYSFDDSRYTRIPSRGFTGVFGEIENVGAALLLERVARKSFSHGQ